MNQPTREVDAAPTEQAGGTKSRGVWPEGVEELRTGDTHTRPVELSDGTVQELEVTVTQILEMLDEDGNPNGGYAVSYQYDDPTAGGTL